MRKSDGSNSPRPAPPPNARPSPFASPPPAPKPEVRPDDAIDLGRGAWAPRSAIVFTFSRSSGPGGQNVNKVNTRAELHLAIAAIRGLHDAARARLRAMAGSHLVKGNDGSGTLHFASDESRSQVDNREGCVERLRALVTAAGVIPKKRKKTKPTRSSVQKRIEGKKREGAKKRERGGHHE